MLGGDRMRGNIRRTKPGQILRAVLVTAAGMIGIASTAFGQGANPSTDPFPMLDFTDPQKSVVVRLRFDDRFNVATESVEVVRERTRVRAGDPPLLKVDVMDLQGGMLETFHAWHPQWVFVEGASGGESRIIDPGAVGHILCPFDAGAAELRITDMAAETEVAVVDILPGVHDFCRDNPGDPDCQSIANRPPECDAGGPYVAECSESIGLDGSASTDLDGDSFTYAWTGSFVGGAASGPVPDVIFEQVGATAVTLSLEDEFGGASVCQADVNVVDTTLPTIDCNNPPTFARPRAPVTFQALAQDSCDGTIIPVIEDFTCSKTNPTGKVVDATKHCRVKLLGDRIQIDGVGLPQVTVRWTVAATDASGNVAREVCSAMAEDASGPPPPGSGPGNNP